MPQDPQGGGSWVVVNELGLSLCLLNYYQGASPPPPLTSRGQLLMSLSHHDSLDALDAALTEIELKCYAPFSLIAFATIAEQAAGKKVTQGYRWDGEQLHCFQPASPLSSSSVHWRQVLPSRAEAYPQGEDINHSDRLLDYHHSHRPGKSHLSVCMHREDAKTVSFSHVEVSRDTIRFNYKDGSPCEMSGYSHSLALAPVYRPTSREEPQSHCAIKFT